MFYNTDGTNTPFSPIIYLFIYYSFYLFLIEVLDYCFYFLLSRSKCKAPEAISPSTR